MGVDKLAMYCERIDLKLFDFSGQHDVVHEAARVENELG
jgi:hypothetical protein